MGLYAFEQRCAVQTTNTAKTKKNIEMKMKIRNKNVVLLGASAVKLLLQNYYLPTQLQKNMNFLRIIIFISNRFFFEYFEFIILSSLFSSGVVLSIENQIHEIFLMKFFFSLLFIFSSNHFRYLCQECFIDLFTTLHVTLIHVMII